MKQKKKTRKLLWWGLGAVATVTTLSLLLDESRKKTAFKSREVIIPSKRQTDIHCSLTIPVTDQPLPLIIMTHGFGADRHEGGRFTAVAEKLAGKGIASIRMDFPGCNESTEAYTAYCLSNMLNDVESGINYMIRQYHIDQKHLGMLGYSMGGRLAVLYAAQDQRIQTLALWAPALTKAIEGLEDFMGGQQKLQEMIAEANEKGFTVFHDPFGGIKQLSKEYFADLEAYDPLEALSRYNHRLLIVQGNADDIVTPSVTAKAITHINKNCHFNYLYMDHANHGFGLWDDHPEQSAKLVKTTASFFDRYL